MRSSAAGSVRIGSALGQNGLCHLRLGRSGFVVVYSNLTMHDFRHTVESSAAVYAFLAMDRVVLAVGLPLVTRVN